MRIRSNTIFSSSPRRTTGEIETKKTNVWLEKLFNQERDREQVVKEKASAEIVKAPIDKAEKNRRAVETIINNSDRVLLRVKSVFPWDLFPSSITIEDTRLTIVHRQLFSSQVHSVDINDVSNIFIDNSILFAQIKIVSDTFAQNQIVISKLWKDQAVLTRRVVEGLRTFISHGIDTSDFEIEELLSKLEELSATQQE